ncbi:MAG TPA: hypothetical protein DCG34_07140 [Clostridiales bacterium]|jgi:hypothetical protein|nr:hypothetical protein [Clostridiales bacterium]
MKKSNLKWRDYEEVSVFLLNKLSEEFGLSWVEGKQKLVGKSGTEWEVEAKGICNNGEGIVIIECRRYSTRKLEQEEMGALAYRIIDTDAESAIIVSPLGLQKGAKLVAEAGGITSVMIDANSTPQNFAVEFFNKLFLGTVMSAGNVKIRAEMSLSRKCTMCEDTFLVKGNETVCQKCKDKKILSL